MQWNDYQQYIVKIHFWGWFHTFNPLKDNASILRIKIISIRGQVRCVFVIVHHSKKKKKKMTIFTRITLTLNSINSWLCPLIFTNRKALECNQHQKNSTFFRKKVKENQVCVWKWADAKANITPMAHMNNETHSASPRSSSSETTRPVSHEGNTVRTYILT